MQAHSMLDPASFNRQLECLHLLSINKQANTDISSGSVITPHQLGYNNGNYGTIVHVTCTFLKFKN